MTKLIKRPIINNKLKIIRLNYNNLNKKTYFKE